jgi:AcrR family transcriptional regulator
MMRAGDDARPSLRERKKMATRRSLRRVALDLVAERGFAHVTIEDIADAAEVSPRTFFNYFPSKEAVIFGADAERTESLRRRLLQRASPGESALAALRAALVQEARARADDVNDLGGDRNEWLCRMKAAHYDPHLRAAASSHMAAVERAIAEALAQRLGTDPDQDPYPVLLAATGTGVLRAAMTFWARTGGKVGLDRLTEVAFAALAGGLAEDCDLRDLADDEPPAATGLTGATMRLTALPTDVTGKDNSR